MESNLNSRKPTEEELLLIYNKSKKHKEQNRKNQENYRIKQKNTIANLLAEKDLLIKTLQNQHPQFKFSNEYKVWKFSCYILNELEKQYPDTLKTFLQQLQHQNLNPPEFQKIIQSLNL